MKIRIVNKSSHPLPAYETEHSAGMDLRAFTGGPVTLKRNAICYSGVIVSPGVTIGENARVGACSLVNKDVEADTFVGGVPAKLVSTLKS